MYTGSLVYSFRGLVKGSNTKVSCLMVRCMMKVSSFRVKDSYRGWGDGQVGMGEIEGDMMRGGFVCGIDRDPALREGVGVRNRDAAGEGDMLKSIGAASAQSSELLLFGGGRSLGGKRFREWCRRGTKFTVESLPGSVLISLVQVLQLLSKTVCIVVLAFGRRVVNFVVGWSGVPRVW